MLTDAQKAARLGRITSSVVPAVLGMDDYTSPYDARLKILGEATFNGNAMTERGDEFEANCISIAAKRTGLSPATAPFVGDIADWAGDSTDALLHDGGGNVVALVEAKTVNGYAARAWGADGTDDVPERVMVQCHWHLIHHPGVPVCYVPALFGGDEFVFKVYEIPRNPEFESFIWEEAKAWHARHIAGDVPVPISHTAADRKALLELHPRDWDDKFLPATPELVTLAERRMAAADAKKKAEKELELCNNQLREAIGEAAGLDASGYSITYRKNKDSSETNWQAVARAACVSEELIYQHTHVVPGDRVLRVARKRSSKGATP